MAWIRGERVTLRAWERDDVRARWEADQTPDASEPALRNWHEPPRSLQQREAEFDAAQEPDPAVVALIIEAEGRVVGDINLFQVDSRNRSALLGLSIWRAEDRDRGFGSDAVAALLRWAFRQYNLQRVELTVDPTNARAIHVYEKLGFTPEGRRREAHFHDGFYADELIMGILAREFEQRDRLSRAEAQQEPEPAPERVTP